MIWDAEHMYINGIACSEQFYSPFDPRTTIATQNYNQIALLHQCFRYSKDLGCIQEKQGHKRKEQCGCYQKSFSINQALMPSFELRLIEYVAAQFLHTPEGLN